jgi:predicted CoA-binding protein
VTRRKEIAVSTQSVLANEFLAERRLAVVGVSHHPQDFSRGLFRELLRRGYDVVPVNPARGEIEGLPCAARVQDVSPPVAGVLVMTRPEVTEQVVRDCVEAGVPRIWLHRGMGPGAVSRAAVDLCRQHGIAVVEGVCPYMFLPASGLVHRAHAFFRRLSRGKRARTAETPQ